VYPFLAPGEIQPPAARPSRGEEKACGVRRELRLKAARARRATVVKRDFYDTPGGPSK
jgi:hypothetical protein